MNKLPQLEDLHVFCLVAQRMSFAATAKELGVSQAYVSKRVKVLEGQLGVPLLHRSTRSVATTANGEHVYHWARRILEEAGMLMEEVSGGGSPRGLLRVGCSIGFGRRHVAPLLARLSTQCPELAIRLDIVDDVIDIVAGGIDLDIRIGNEIEPHLIARKLAANRRVLCAAPAYVAARGMPVDLEQLAAHDCLLIKERDHPFGVWRLTGPDGDCQLKTSGRLSSNHGEIVRAWALDGRGIMLRSLWDIGACLARGELVQVLPQYWQPADIWAVYSERLSGSAKLRVTVEFLQMQLQQMDFSKDAA